MTYHIRPQFKQEDLERIFTLLDRTPGYEDLANKVGMTLYKAKSRNELNDFLTKGRAARQTPTTSPMRRMTEDELMEFFANLPTGEPAPQEHEADPNDG